MSEAIWGVTGLLGGFLFSVGWWYFITHYIAPRLQFGEHISLLSGPNGTHRYRVKLVNAGKRRRLIDCSIHASLRFPGVPMYPGSAPGALYGFALDVSDPYVVQIAPGKSRVVHLRVEESLENELASGSLLLEKLYPIADQRLGLTLTDLLRRSAGAYVIVRVLCYDEWSGSRKLFESPHYTLTEIRNGHFRGNIVADSPDT